MIEKNLTAYHIAFTQKKPVPIKKKIVPKRMDPFKTLFTKKYRYILLPDNISL